MAQPLNSEVSGPLHISNDAGVLTLAINQSITDWYLPSQGQR